MFTFIGVLLLLFATAVFIMDKVATNAKQENEVINATNEIRSKDATDAGYSSYNRVPRKKYFEFPFKVPKSLVAGLGVLLILANGFFFWAQPGTAYSVQYPWGGDKMVTTQGIKVKAWGRTIPLSYEMSIKDVILRVDSDGKTTELEDNEIGIYNRKAQLWEFSDAIKADIATSVIIGPSIDDEVQFLSMADKNRSESKLIYGRILPNIDAALKNTCKLMDAQEYISGKASDFDIYFKDQLENGMYLVEEVVENISPVDVIGDTTVVRTVMNSSSEKSNETKKYKIRRDAQGNIMRDKTSNTLKQYGLKISQAKVTSIDWENSFDTRLDKQKNEVALTQLEKQEAERQFYTTQKIIAEGEATKASKRITLETKQLEETITAETKAKVAIQDLIAAQTLFEKAEIDADAKTVAADATYYENQKMVSAGLTPQERLAGEITMNNDKWSHIGTMKFDGVYMNGVGGKGNDGILSQLLGAEVAKGMNLKSIK